METMRRTPELPLNASRVPDAGQRATPPASLLVSPEELAAHLEDPRWRIVDLRERWIYLFQGHIPGAIWLDVDLLGDPRTKRDGLPLPPDLAQSLFQTLGIHEDSIVVACDDAGGLFAARLFYVLEAFGHPGARVLNGGVAGWHRQGYPLTREIPWIPPGTFSVRPQPERVATAEWVLAHLKDPEVVLWDTRTRAEFTGRKVKALRGGHIPGAVHLDWREVLDSRTGCFLPLERIRERLTTLGILPDREVVTYCHAGLRAAHGYFVARLLGYPRVRNYDASWEEWGSNPDLPLER